MKNNLEIINKILNKYQKHLNVRLKLICNKEIIFDGLLENDNYSISFIVDNLIYTLVSNKEIDLEIIKIALEDYLVNNYEKLLKKALFEESDSPETQREAVFTTVTKRCWI